MSEPSFRKTLGRAVAAARAAKGWSQEHLADAAGVSRNGVSLVERGQITCSAWTALRLARALGVSLDALVSPEDALPSPSQLRLAEAVRAIPSKDHERAALLLGLAFATPAERPSPRPYPRAKRRGR